MVVEEVDEHLMEPLARRLEAREVDYKGSTGYGGWKKSCTT